MFCRPGLAVRALSFRAFAVLLVVCLRPGRFLFFPGCWRCCCWGRARPCWLSQAGWLQVVSFLLFSVACLCLRLSRACVRSCFLSHAPCWVLPLVVGLQDACCVRRPGLRAWGTTCVGLWSAFTSGAVEYCLRLTAYAVGSAHSRFDAPRRRAAGLVQLCTGCSCVHGSHYACTAVAVGHLHSKGCREQPAPCGASGGFSSQPRQRLTVSSGGARAMCTACTEGAVERLHSMGCRESAGMLCAGSARRSLCVLLVGFHIKDFLPCSLRRWDQRAVAWPRSCYNSTMVHRGIRRGLWCIPSRVHPAFAAWALGCTALGRLLHRAYLQLRLQGCVGVAPRFALLAPRRALIAPVLLRLAGAFVRVLFFLASDCVSLAAVPRVRLALASA